MGFVICEPLLPLTPEELGAWAPFFGADWCTLENFCEVARGILDVVWRKKKVENRNQI
jgi:hypothetical protein